MVSLVFLISLMDDTPSPPRIPRPTVGEQVVTKAGHYACPTRDLLTEFLAALIAKDGVATLSTIRRGCEILDGGRAVVLEVPAFGSTAT